MQKSHIANMAASLALSVMLLPGIASASALAQFKSFVSSTKSAKGDFEQELLNAKSNSANKVGSPSAKSSGTFIFARPGKFIWTYKQPYEQLLQADGETLFIYDKDLNQVTIKKLGDALGSSPAAILFGSNDLEKNFTLKEGEAKDGVEWLEATPKSKETTFAQIDIGMRNGVPEIMKLQDTLGGTSLLTFKNFVKNPPAPADGFKFVPPKGADVLKE